ncbi:hypothetical protein ACMT90_06900 [Clavibacter sp. Sh2126]
MFEHDSAARQRTTGEPSFRQVMVLVAVSSVITSFSAAFLRMGLIAGPLFIVVGIVALSLIGRVILKRVNLRRNR